MISEFYREPSVKFILFIYHVHSPIILSLSYFPMMQKFLSQVNLVSYQSFFNVLIMFIHRGIKERYILLMSSRKFNLLLTAIF